MIGGDDGSANWRDQLGFQSNVRQLRPGGDGFRGSIDALVIVQSEMQTRCIGKAAKTVGTEAAPDCGGHWYRLACISILFLPKQRPKHPRDDLTE
ncbi:hypothetical protein [Rhodopirellula halodulae]|uniref:hypothetical protein n=1 Tax=Rhodopirellula halodulae TaxID=2894198 RepID=UPI001E5E9DBE|nr:hypothetical protein [Rhodopirellula sp. JC737]MCC9655703.1 hypothetical protein [Rhodopirellula sp. JC737]